MKPIITFPLTLFLVVLLVPFLQMGTTYLFPELPHPTGLGGKLVYAGYFVLAWLILFVQKRSIAVGESALLLFMGQKTHIQLTEGECLLPAFLSIQTGNVRKQILDLPPVEVQSTKDGEQMEVRIDAAVDYKVISLYRWFEIADFKEQLKTSVESAIRLSAAVEDRDILTAGTYFRDEIMAELGNSGERWGVNIVDVKIKDIQPANAELLRALELQKIAKEKKKSLMEQATTLNEMSKKIKDGHDRLDDKEAILHAARILGTIKSEETIISSRGGKKGADPSLILDNRS